MLQLHPPLSLSNLEENMVHIDGGIMEIQNVDIQLDDFELCRYLVSQRLWKDVMGSYPDRLRFRNPNRPVERISWRDIQEEFLPALRDKTNDSSWTLPTEFQWEYGARGGKYAKPCIYAGSNQLKEVGWFSMSNGSNINSYQEINPIATKYSNSLGIYDMSGNVWEWCQNRFDDYFYLELLGQYSDRPAPNPGGPKVGNKRVVRGGSWGYDLLFSKVSFSYDFDPFTRYDFVGFRLCRHLV